MKLAIYSLLFIFFTTNLSAQAIEIIPSQKPEVSFRGLSVIDNFTFWVSGSHGTIGFSVNGGKSMKWVNPVGYENRDFRDIVALNHKTIVAVAIGSPGIILKSSDYGNTWIEVYHDDDPNVFLDAMDFYANNPNIGIAVGDPINGEPYILKTIDAGNTWERLSIEDLPRFAINEAFFAASGSNVQLLDENYFLAVSGGAASNIMLNTFPPLKTVLPKSSSITAGANAVDYSTIHQYGIVVGGDYKTPESSENNIFRFTLTEDKKIILEDTPTTPPSGYLSGVKILNNGDAISCGLTGVSISNDKGLTWKPISAQAFHTVKSAKFGSKIYLVGPQGRIASVKE